MHFSPLSPTTPSGDLAAGPDAWDTLLDDPLVTLVTQVADQFGEAAMPGTFLVDVFPFCMSPVARLEALAG